MTITQADKNKLIHEKIRGLCWHECQVTHSMLYCLSCGGRWNPSLYCLHCGNKADPSLAHPKNPDYFTDLNACHEAEKCLRDVEGVCYSEWRSYVDLLDGYDRRGFIHLDAPSRAEALYRIAKVREEEK